MTPVDDLRRLAEGLRRKHTVVEDCWYSCPRALSEDGDSACCSDEFDAENPPCWCGADAHNARLDDLLDRLAAAESQREALDVAWMLRQLGKSHPHDEDTSWHECGACEVYRYLTDRAALKEQPR